MVSDICKLTILGAGVGIFLISFGLYEMLVEKDQKIENVVNIETLSNAENRFNEAVLEVELWQKNCNEDIPKEDEQESSQCFSILKQKRIELTAAQMNVYDIKSKLGLE